MSRLRATAFTNPMYHLTAFSLRNPMVLWAIEHGAYGFACADCGGTGSRRDRWGDPYWCFTCDGSGFRPVDKVCAKDFADAESLAIAREVAPALLKSAEANPQQWHGGLR